MKMMKKISVLFIILILVVGCGNSATDDAYGEKTATLDKDVIKVGMELQYPPFETKNTAGEPDGVSVQLAYALGEYLDKEIEIVDTRYASLIPALETGNIDIIISSMTVTPERLERVDFSDEYTSAPLMVLAHIDSKVNSPEDINDPEVKIAVKSGTVAEIWAKTNAQEATLINIEEEATAVLEVAQGKADIFIYDPLSVIRHNQNYPDTTKAILEPLPNTKGWGIAMRKDEDELKERINAFLEEAKEDGTYDEIRQNYLQDEIAEFEEYGLDFFF